MNISCCSGVWGRVGVQSSIQDFILGGGHVCWEYLTASMHNFKSGVDSRGGIQVRGGESPFPRVLYETLVCEGMSR